MIFAREASDSLTSLVKKLDAATAKNSDAKMGSFVVFCNDDEDLKDKLKDLAKKEHLEKIVLSIDSPAGPEPEIYKVAKDADITVILYDKRDVKVNKAYKKGEFSAKDDDGILAGVEKMIAQKKKDDAKKKEEDKKKEE